RYPAPLVDGPGRSRALEGLDLAVDLELRAERDRALIALVVAIVLDPELVPARPRQPLRPADVLHRFVGFTAGVAIDVELPTAVRLLGREVDVLTARREAVEVQVVAVVPEQRRPDRHLVEPPAGEHEALPDLVVDRRLALGHRRPREDEE